MLPCLRHTPNVTFERIAPGGFRILAALDDATQTIGQDLTITAGTNDHATGRHPLGEAFDIRSKDLDVATILRVYDVLHVRLGPLFTVLYETPTVPSDARLRPIATVNPKASAEHFHVQVKRHTDYPPADDVLKA